VPASPCVHGDLAVERIGARIPTLPSGASEQEFRDPAEARPLRMGELRHSPVSPVLDRLRQVNRLDSASAVEVCDRARDLEGEVNRSRREP
jgi:hypothetical protein